MQHSSSCRNRPHKAEHGIQDSAGGCVRRNRGAGVACPSGGDTRAVKSRVQPVYPEIAKRMHISGQVELQVTVDAQGKVKDVKPVSGNHVLSAAAEDAVRHWKYVAGDGDSVVTVTINFALDD